MANEAIKIKEIGDDEHKEHHEFLIKEIGDDEHKEHHEFLRECIPLLREYLEDHKASRERWEKYRTSFFGAIFSAIGVATVSVLAWISGVILDYIRNNGGNP